MISTLRIAVILNPTAGRGRARRRWNAWRPLLEDQVGPCDVFETSATRDGIALCRQALKSGYTRIISAGGDGTHFEVTNGYFESGQPINPEASIAFLPLGSGADFTKTLRMPDNMDAMLGLLSRWETQSIDVVSLSLTGFDGQPEEWIFQNIARAGIGAEVVARAERSQKRLGGFLTFLLATVQTVLHYRSKPVRLQLDAETVKQQFMELVVANGIYDGGGMRTAPEARLDSGLLEVYVYGKIQLADALVNLYKIYKGTMMDRPDVVRHNKVRTVCLESSREILVEADGELLGVAPATFRVCPAALNVVINSPPALAE